MTQQIAERAEYTTKCSTCNVVFTDPQTYELHLIRHTLDDIANALDWIAREIVSIRHNGITTKKGGYP